MDQDARKAIHIYVDACITWCSTVCQTEAYHREFHQSVLLKQWFICQLEALNAAAEIKRWAQHTRVKKAVLHNDSATAVPVFQARCGRDLFLQGGTRGIWLVCVIHDLTLSFVHTSEDQLTDTADALSCHQMGGVFRNRVHQIMNQGVQIVSMSDYIMSCLQLCNHV